MKGLKYPRILQNRSTNLLLKDYLELCLIAQFMCYDGSAQHRRNLESFWTQAFSIKFSPTDKNNARAMKECRSISDLMLTMLKV